MLDYKAESRINLRVFPHTKIDTPADGKCGWYALYTIFIMHPNIWEGFAQKYVPTEHRTLFLERMEDERSSLAKKLHKQVLDKRKHTLEKELALSTAHAIGNSQKFESPSTLFQEDCFDELDKKATLQKLSYLVIYYLDVAYCKHARNR